LPAQLDLEARFGQPPITVFSAGRFLIQVLLWMDDVMAIHQHSFSGAFLQLEGCGLHIVYRFEAGLEACQRFWLGNIVRQQTELLRPGEVRAITPSLAHANFHLDRPTATVVIRTFDDPISRPEFYYLRPHVALDRFPANAVLVRRLQVLKFLLDADPKAHDMSATRLLREADLHTAFLVLEQATAHLDDARLERLMAVVRRRRSDASILIGDVLNERRRERALQRARNIAGDENLRLLFALLIALDDREAILDILAQRYPGADPVSLIDTWLGRLRPSHRSLLRIGNGPLPSIASSQAAGAGLLAPLFAAGMPSCA
jgi:hypothetical protein